MKTLRMLMAFMLAFALAVPAGIAYAAEPDDGAQPQAGLGLTAASPGAAMSSQDSDGFKLECDLEDGFTMRGDTKTFRAHGSYYGAYHRVKAYLYRYDENGSLTLASTPSNSYASVHVVWHDKTNDTLRLQMEDQPPGDYVVRVGLEDYSNQREPWWRPKSDLVREYRFTYKKTPAGGCIGTAVIDIEAFTIGLGYIEEPALVPIYQGENAAQVLDRFLRERGYTYLSTGSLTNGFYLGSISGGALDVSQAQVDPTVAAALTAHENDGYEFDPTGYQSEDTLGQFDFSSGSGWMYSINGDFPNVGFSDWTLSDGDIIRVQFTLALGFDLGAAAADGSHGSYYALADREEATKYLAYLGTALNAQAILDDPKAARLIAALQTKLGLLGSNNEDDIDPALDALRYYLEHSGGMPAISLPQSELSVLKNSSTKLVPQVGGADGLVPQVVEWDSSDTVVATVDPDGTVHAHANGEAVIAARLGSSVARCVVTVYGSPLEDFEIIPYAYVADTGYRVTQNIEKLQDDGSYLLRPGESVDIEVMPIPADTVDPLTTAMESTDPQVATVQTAGAYGDSVFGKVLTVNAVSAGEADIIVRIGAIEHRAHIVVREAELEGFGIYEGVEPEYVDSTGANGEPISHLELFVGDYSQADHGYLNVCPLPNANAAELDPQGKEAWADDEGLVDVYLARAKNGAEQRFNFYRLHVYAKGAPGETDVHVRLGTYTRTVHVTVKQAHAVHLHNVYPTAESLARLSQVFSATDSERTLRLGVQRWLYGSTETQLTTKLVEYQNSGIADFEDTSEDDIYFETEFEPGSDGLLSGDGVKKATGRADSTSSEYTVAANATGTAWVHATTGAPYDAADLGQESTAYAVRVVEGDIVPVEKLYMMRGSEQVARGGATARDENGNVRWLSVEGSMQLAAGEEVQLSAAVEPADASAVPVWASLDQRIVKVDPKTGLLRAIHGGDAAVVLACGGYFAKLEVHVSETAGTLAIGADSFALARGETLALPVSLESWSANTDAAMSFASSDTGVATVDGNGIVRAVGYGEATVTATAPGYEPASCTVTVGNPLRDAFFAGGPYAMTRGDDLDLASKLRFRTADGAEAAPGTEGAVWASSNEAVATVDGDGNVHAVGAGTCTIRARVHGLVATCNVTVRVPLERIVLPERVDVYVGEQVDIEAIPDPSDATMTTGVVWANSRETFAYMLGFYHNNGGYYARVTGLKPGVTVITVTFEGKTASCEVHVNRTPAQQAVFELQTAIRAWVAAYPDPEAAGVDHAAYVAAADEISAMWAELTDAQRAQAPEYGESFEPEAERIERVRAVAACEALMHAAAGGDASAVAAARAALAALDAGQKATVSASATADLQKGEAVIEKAKQEAAAAEKAKQEAEAAEKARKEAAEKAAAEKAAADKARKEAEAAEKARKEAEAAEKAKQEAAKKAKQEAAEKARKEAAEKATNVANAAVTVGAAAYTGKARTPSVKVVLGGRTLKAGTDYALSWSNNVKAGKSAKVTVKGKGGYHGSKTAGFAISAAKNSVTVKKKAVTKKLKASKKTGKLAAKKTFKLKSLVKATSKFGALTFAKKKGSASIKVSKSGKITAKKGLKRGTYALKVKVSAAKTANWSAASKTVTVKVVVR